MSIAVQPITVWFTNLFDPRGRCSRKGLAWVALVLLPAQLVFAAAIVLLELPWSHPVALVIKAVFLWTAVAAVVKRLHDMDRSGYWLPGGFLIFFGWGIIVGIATLVLFGAGNIAAGSPAFVFNVTLNTAVMVAALLYLHFKKGQAHKNRYGLEPDASGFGRALPRVGKSQPAYTSDAATV